MYVLRFFSMIYNNANASIHPPPGCLDQTLPPWPGGELGDHAGGGSSLGMMSTHSHTRCLELRACNSQPSEPFIYWGLKIYRSTFNDISLCKKKCNHKIRVQECYGGGATSCQWCHVMSHDVIGMMGGWDVSQRGGLSWKVDQFGNLNNPSHFN